MTPAARDRIYDVALAALQFVLAMACLACLAKCLVGCAP